MKQKLIVIDNYDSFTYNLVEYLRDLTGDDPVVVRNDAITLESLDEYDIIILSPGPGLPEEAGLLKQIIKKYGPTKKMLGVCLGHQAIAEVYGGSLANLSRVYHGVATQMKKTINDHFLFDSLPESFEAGRYHSWIVQSDSLPEELEVLARDDEGQIMALQHKEYELYGVQFHPESILTPEGKRILKNFLDHCEPEINPKNN